MSQIMNDIAKERQRVVEEMLDRYWCRLMDDNSSQSIAFARGIVEACKYLGLLNDAEAEGWSVRMGRCPYQGDAHNGGQQWCAFCGDLDEHEYIAE